MGIDTLVDDIVAAHDITDFIQGVNGQLITIIANQNNSLTIKDNDNIKTKSEADVILAFRENLTFIKILDTRLPIDEWYEI